MKHKIKVTLLLSKIVFLNQINYRLGALIWMVNGFITPLILMSAWLTVRNQTYLALNQDQIITYYLLAIVIGRLTQTWTAESMAEKIKDGKLSKTLVKPLSNIQIEVGKDFALRTIRLITMTPFILIALVTSLDHFEVILSPQNVAIFFIALIIGYLINLAMETIIGLSTFWLEHFTGILGMYWTLTWFLNGSAIPLSLMPNSLQTILSFLPFKFVLYYPIEIITTDISVTNVALQFALAICWLAALTITARLLYKKGVTKYLAIGG